MTAVKSEVSNALDTLWNSYFSEIAVGETTLSDDFQPGVRLEDNFAKLETIAECIALEFSNSVGNEYLFYVALTEPIGSYDLEPAREAQHIRIFLV